MLAESVATRLRAAGVGRANTVHIVVRNSKMEDTTCQMKVPPTALCGDIAKAAMELYKHRFPTPIHVRMLGITLSGFDNRIEQLTLDDFLGEDRKEYDKRERAEAAVAKLRQKYGYLSVQRGVLLEDETTSKD